MLGGKVEMGMTIEEIILEEKEIAEEFQRTVDTHMVNSNLSLERMFCDDTEIIEKELKMLKKLSDYHNTIANTMRKYQQIQEIVKRKDYDSFNRLYYYGDFLRVQDIRKVLDNGNDD